MLATFEDVIVDIFVPGDVSEEAMRAAVSPEPAEVIYNYSRDWCGGSVLQVRWPGVPVEGASPFPTRPRWWVRGGNPPASPLR